MKSQDFGPFCGPKSIKDSIFRKSVNLIVVCAHQWSMCNKSLKISLISIEGFSVQILLGCHTIFQDFQNRSRIGITLCRYEIGISACGIN